MNQLLVICLITPTCITRNNPLIDVFWYFLQEMGLVGFYLEKYNI